tara:strand:- start:113 stop:580 length:468 start_codon:yes stop_codon:yes gene_type:complete
MKLTNIFLLKFFFVLFCYVFLVNEELISEKIKYANAIVTTSSGIQIQVEIADTISKRNLGLGKRSFLKKNWGMLFVFDKLKAHHFWMKDMNFPLDIIWLNNNRIVHIIENANPSNSGVNLPILKPLEPANFVLEIAAGQANKLKLKKGDFLNYKF